MQNKQLDITHISAAAWWRWGSVVIGLVAIALLLWIFVATVQEHMSKAHEVSRHARWHLHAPVAGAQAAAALQGSEPGAFGFNTAP